MVRIIVNWAVVVDQLAEQSLTAKKEQSLKPVIGKIYIEHLQKTKDENKKKFFGNVPLWKEINNYLIVCIKRLLVTIVKNQFSFLLFSAEHLYRYYSKKYFHQNWKKKNILSVYRIPDQVIINFMARLFFFLQIRSRNIALW